MPPAPTTSRFRDRISGPLIRILRLYVALITALVMGLTVLATYFYQHSELEHQREQIATRLVAEVTTQASELSALATSSLLWTGLTDSKGREVYLAPLLERFNRGAVRKFYVLDYRGRVFIAPSSQPESVGLAITSDPVVVSAVRELRDGFGLRVSEKGELRILLIQRVLNPNVDATVGFIVASIDVAMLVRQVDVEKGVNLSIAVGDLPLTPPPSERWMFTREGRSVAVAGELSVPLRVWVGTSIYSSILFSLLGMLTALLLGWWTISRVNTWVRRFAMTTTQRLDRLLVECQKILAGQRLEAVEPGPDDELSQVTLALNTMLVKQRQATDDLRATSLVFSMAAEGILLTDPRGRIVEVNAALLAMTGYTRADLIGQHSGTLYRTAGDRELSRRMAAEMADKGRWNGETYFVGRNEQRIPASVAISRIVDDQGGILGNVAVITDISRLKKIEHQLRDLANQDALTGLSNFRHMSEQVQESLEKARRASQSLAVIFLDLDKFKAVNDEHGHDAGDALIKAVGAHLSRRLPAGHLLCRRSGDEFIAVVARAPGDRSELNAVLNGLTPLEVATEADTLSVTATIGVSRFPEDATDWHELQICADMAMNRAKQERRGSVVWYDPGIGRKLQRRRQIEGRLRDAIRDKVIDVHYQPEVDLRTGQVIGFEALARWHDAALGHVSPSEFVAVAEEMRVMETFTLCIAEKVLRDKPLLQARFPGAVVAFNASPQVFRRASLLEFLSERSLHDENVLEGLEVELTETELSRIDPALLMQVQAIVGMGVRLVIDDFGTGYSSLSRLTQFPISRLKIDRSFVEALGRARGMRIARLVIDLAKVMGFEVTAEGVETLEQRDSLVQMGCHRGQGWLFAKAMPASELLARESPVQVHPAPLPGEPGEPGEASTSARGD